MALNMKRAGMMENWKTGMMGNPKITVTPAEAGVQSHTNLLDSRFRACALKRFGAQAWE
jgi:hypothetical protein